MKLIKQIPNFLTLINLLLGASACIIIIEHPGQNLLEKCSGHIHVLPVSGDMNALVLASFLLIAAALFDFFDGFIARLLNANSAMGEQLDSLADMISFGLAPGLIMYQLLNFSYASNLIALDTPNYYFHIALFIPACAAWRLARFNSSNIANEYFTGLPAPAAALFIISMPLILMSHPAVFHYITGNSTYLFSIIFLLGILMISNFKLISLKIKKWKWNGNEFPLSLIIISIILFGFLSYLAIPIIIGLYIILSFIYFKLNKFRTNEL